MFIKFEVSPEGRVTGMYYGLGADATLLGRKETGRGRGGGRSTSPPPRVCDSSLIRHRRKESAGSPPFERGEAAFYRTGVGAEKAGHVLSDDTDLSPPADTTMLGGAGADP